MPDISGFHFHIVFVHMLGVFLFLLAHGVSAGVLLRLRSEREPAAVRALVGLSATSVNVMSVGLAILFFAGIAAGFSGNYWTSGRLWIWASLVIMIVIVGLMTPLGRLYVNRIREAVGIDPKTGALIPDARVDPAALGAAVRSGQPILLAVVGVGGVAVLAWLMMYKPF